MDPKRIRHLWNQNFCPKYCRYQIAGFDPAETANGVASPADSSPGGRWTWTQSCQSDDSFATSASQLLSTASTASTASTFSCRAGVLLQLHRPRRVAAAIRRPPATCPGAAPWRWAHAAVQRGVVHLLHRHQHRWTHDDAPPASTGKRHFDFKCWELVGGMEIDGNWMILLYYYCYKLYVYSCYIIVLYFIWSMICPVGWGICGNVCIDYPLRMQRTHDMLTYTKIDCFATPQIFHYMHNYSADTLWTSI